MQWFIFGEKEAWDNLQKEFANILMWGPPPDTRTEEEKYLDTLKLAMVKRKGAEYQELLYMSNTDGKVYEVVPDTYAELKEPLEEIKEFEFIRWGRPMDL